MKTLGQSLRARQAGESPRFKGISWFPDWLVRWTPWGRAVSRCGDAHDALYRLPGTRWAKDEADKSIVRCIRAAGTPKWLCRIVWRALRTPIADSNYCWVSFMEKQRTSPYGNECPKELLERGKSDACAI